MDIYEAIYTTRSMRRLRPDPIPLDIQARILDAAIRAPSEPDARRFILVDDPELRGQIAALYISVWEEFVDPATIPPVFQRTFRSGDHLARHFAEVPLLLFGFGRGSHGGSVFPALQNAMLAARAEGVGSTLTMFLNSRQDEVMALHGVPADEGWRMNACVTLGYPTGRWGIAPRQPAHQVTFRNRWGAEAGFEVPEPLWQPEGEGDNRSSSGEGLPW
ncbi:MAG TPA: nitroreductase family protein [Chloroflexota bacterium]|nr:nitroreductase family protein [Chloroflexota bacterium]